MVKPNTRKVWVERQNMTVESMYRNWGWEVVRQLAEADLACFTGGSDVSPMLYDSPLHPSTNNNLQLDQACFEQYWKALYEMPMVGICRGAQFLNVVNGGVLFQHVDNHLLSVRQTHKARLIHSGESIDVTSTHHQMMIPNKEDGEVLMVANETNCRQLDTTEPCTKYLKMPDIEAVWYKDSNTLCYQPHPEYVNPQHECQKVFFEMIEEYLF